MVKVSSAFYTILIFMIAGCSNEGDRANISRPVISPESQINTVQIKARNIDLEAKKIEREDTWYSIWNVVDAIKKELPAKDSYESKADYKARIKDFGSKTLFDDVSLKGNFIFPLDSQFFEYDPEVKGFKYYAFATSVSSWSQKYNSLKIGDRAGPDDSDTLGKIEAWRNQVNKPIKNRSFAYIEDGKNLPSQTYVKIFYKIDPDAAKKLHRSLKAYVVGSIEFPFYYRDEDHPLGESDILADVHVLPFSIRGFWLVDSKTGEVLTKTYKLTRKRD